jgi:carbamate kinase
MSKEICVIAIGGNAILTENDKGTIEEQMNNIRSACQKIVNLVILGYQIVITHGNGPQVGQALLRHKLSSNKVPEGQLDTCGAETQGLLGYLIQQVLRNELIKAGVEREVIAVVTQVLVSKDDKAFLAPSKPIGPFYSKEEAEKLALQYNKKIVEDSGRGYRLVVPSPTPIDIVEKNTISYLLKSGAIVIAGGGGGIPVIRKEDEGNGDQLIGIEAVIDKDVASGVLAKMINADYLMLLTGVDKVSLYYKKPNEKPLDILTVAEGEQYLSEGHFPEGSMAPKIRAALDFVKNDGKKAIITSLEHINEALEGKTGTTIVLG